MPANKMAVEFSLRAFTSRKSNIRTRNEEARSKRASSILRGTSQTSLERAQFAAAARDKVPDNPSASVSINDSRGNALLNPGVRR